MHRIRFTLLFILWPSFSWSNFWEMRDLNIGHEGNDLVLTIGSFEIQSLNIRLQDVIYSCAETNQVYPLHRCHSGLLEMTYEGTRFEFISDINIDILNDIVSLGLSNNEKTLALRWTSLTPNQLTIKTSGLAVNDYLKIALSENISGQLDSQIMIDFENQLSVSGTYDLKSLNYESKDSTVVLADVSVKGEINLKSVDDNINIQLQSLISNGEGLIKDLYLNFKDSSFKASVDSMWGPSFEFMEANLGLDLNDGNQLIVSTPSDSINESFQIEFDIDDLNSFYNKFLKSYLELYGLNQASIDGGSEGQVQIINGKITQISLETTELNFDAPKKKISFDELNTNIFWNVNSHQNSSVVKWNRAVMAGLPIGGVDIELMTFADQVTFQQQIRLPVFDGVIQLNELKLYELFSPEVSADFYGKIEPISLDLITKRLNWPVMKGSISGEIPGVVKRGSRLIFDGEMKLKVFDGNVIFSNISTERLFGVAPVISGDVTFDNLSLEKVTSTYDFGAMSGVIQGFVNDLRITNWKTERLDGYVESVDQNSVKQTISQRALDNISSIGGVQGAISRSFLKFFEEFKFKKLAVGCKLRNSVCAISGIEDTQSGFYLVKGKGVPKINIVGYRKFIDWEIFIDRLLNASY